MLTTEEPNQLEFTATVLNLAHKKFGPLPIPHIEYPYTAQSIYEMSPTGELWPVFELIRTAHMLVDSGKIQLP